MCRPDGYGVISIYQVVREEVQNLYVIAGEVQFVRKHARDLRRLCADSPYEVVVKEMEYWDDDERAGDLMRAAVAYLASR